MVHPRRVLLRANEFFIAGVILLILASGVRLAAHDFSVQGVHMPDTPGTMINAHVLDQEKFDALVELARVGLVLGGVTCSLAVAAKLFVPAAYPPVVEFSQRDG